MHDPKRTPAFDFHVYVDGEPAYRFYGLQWARNAVLSQLSDCVLAASRDGHVDVFRTINGRREPCHDWRRLAH